MSARDRARAGPARRAVLRWAWRLFRREWRQQVVVLALMTVAVAVAVAGATVAATASSSSHGQFGDADAMARIDASNPDAARAAVAAATERFGAVEVISHRSVAIPGSVKPLDVRSQDPAATFSRPLLALRSGRLPAGRDEVALTHGAARLLSAHVGAQLDLGGVTRTVVGTVENPDDLQEDFALLAPHDDEAADSLTLLFNETRRVPPATGTPNGPSGPNFPIIVRGDNGPVAALVLIATTLAMSLVGLIAASGFIVVAQRRQRQLGMLAAIGASERHLRLVMLATGTIAGAVAAGIGTVLGVLGWIAVAPVAEAAANHRIDRLALPWGLIAACGLLAVAMGTAAAWWPARNLARMPVMAALSGRPSRPRPVHRSLVAALALLALGLAGIVAARPTGDVRPLMLIAGNLGVVLGVVFAAPAAIRALAAPATRLPIAPRLALRDLSRYQARAAAALAAITLGLGISVTVVGIASANEYRSDEGNLSDRQIVIWVGNQRTAPDPELSPAGRNALDARAATVAATLGHPTLLTLDVAINPASDPTSREPVAESIAVGAHTWRFVSYPYVATPQVLRHFHIDPATIGDATELLTVQTGDVLLLDFTARPDPTNRDSAVQRVDLSSYTSAPTSLVTEAAMRRHGWVPARTGWLIDSDRRLTAAQIAAARSAAADAGLVIETRSGQDGLAALRTGATTVGALLALAILAMTIGLVRSEAGRDVRTLTATGASGRTRRALTASTSGALAVLGVVLGVAGAYAALAAAYHADLNELTPLPLTHLLLLAVGLPVVATAGGWILAGREPRTFSRQALD